MSSAEEEFDKLEEKYGTVVDMKKRKLFSNVTIEEFPSFTKSDNIEKEIEDGIEEEIEKTINNENENEVD